MNEIIEYVREKRNGQIQKVGVLVATIYGNDINIGWSKVALKKQGKITDIFDKERGIIIARSRKNKARISQEVIIPYSIRKQLKTFKDRCLRYFKGAEFSMVANELLEQAEKPMPKLKLNEDI